MNKNVNDMFNDLVEGGLFTEDELTLITNINGYSVDTLNDCLYARYGYRSLDQIMDEILVDEILNGSEEIL